MDAPPLRDFGALAGLTAKDAANRVLTVQRAFRRLLKEEIRLLRRQPAIQLDSRAAGCIGAPSIGFSKNANCSCS